MCEPMQKAINNKEYCQESIQIQSYITEYHTKIALCGSHETTV